MNFSFPAIGIIHSCFKEKFGIPRQPGLAPLATAQLELLPPYNDWDALNGLDGCSHIWIQFVFHANKREAWKPKVKPPRLGGNKSLGVFATRSPTRPAPIGLSVVKLESIEEVDGKLLLNLSGIDLLDGTPVLDIKPYVPYVDLVPEATNSFADAPPKLIPVEFSSEANAICSEHRQKTQINLETLIRQVLQQDPRPQYQQPEPERVYGMKLLDVDVQWQYPASESAPYIVVTSINKLPPAM
ncbi:putative S-adenosylmethionine-dependent methyltransferase RcsF [Cellvibrio zantedeschiae]|uniref:S-adenosylmethionine-dependent methyltransferase RcsF n=1 Tax=Cellvibrio zantedeschiae TaxID=1237077 RepID=A0ABQ3BAZ4_9GAMM|nr:tRNA (N6-threonylcarbamoyladenosine(37)-N6)-methyltransferase TrmO [Cellvibrio zantedeschiae]GGY83745.1 putative S-adenosylmethionine-dependent methyltransferase RcsF [Cellvibrio zantedeschiae]